jgi:hypothetical protein
MFTIYAALAYVVPHILCADTVSDLPVREKRETERRGGASSLSLSLPPHPLSLFSSLFHFQSPPASRPA